MRRTFLVAALLVCAVIGLPCAGTTGNYNLFLGANVTGTASDTNTIRIGLPYDGTNGQNQTFIAGIYGTPMAGVSPVVINASGQLGTTPLLTFAANGDLGIRTTTLTLGARPSNAETGS
jgi:hypothetical protein